MNNSTTVSPQTEVSALEQILAKLSSLESKVDSRLESIDDKLEAIEVRLADMDLDSGSGFSEEVY